jgi:CRP-like cAMP-binding protein
MSDVTLTIDGLAVTVPSGTTVFDAARMNGIAIPTLCHQQNETPAGVCRVCVVEAGGRVLTASCIRPAENKMVVATNSPKVAGVRKTIVELLMADHPSPCARQRHSGDCELETLAKRDGVPEPARFAKRISPRGQDNSSPSIAVDHEACILCDRCVRGCVEIKHNNVLGRRGKGFMAGVAFDLNQLMGNSKCVSCGECMVSCPTGALTNKVVVATELGTGTPVPVEDLQKLTFFQKVSGTFLELNQHAVVERRFRPGEIICREGEYGSTAFYIVSGKAEVFLSTPMAHVKTEGGTTGFLSKLASRLTGRSQDTREDENRKLMIPIDASVDLPYDRPVAELGQGDLFGEMTCMSLYPRSATVRAITECVMYEMLRNVLDIMQRNKSIRGLLDEKYKKQALEDHLKSVPLFSSLPADFIDSLRTTVELKRYGKGDVICRQGEVADSFYLIRIGFVKVTETHMGSDLVLAYLGRGGYFGEIGLLTEGGRRTATCTALDHLEVVRIAATDFHRMMDTFPAIRENLSRVADEHIRQNEDALTKASSVPLERFLANGLFEAQSLLVLDLEKCTRCDNCVRACADAHDGVTRLTREGLRFENFLVATSCRQCRDPLCMIGCPVGAIRRRQSLEVIIEDWCIGCGLCANNCPYGNITIHPFQVTESGPSGQRAEVTKKKATSCDLCRNHAEPSCVYACPHDAAHRVDPNEFFEQVLKASSTTGTAGGMAHHT